MDENLDGDAVVMADYVRKGNREKPEDLVGKFFNHGKLKVVGIHGKIGTTTLFKVVCSVCSKDRELFPDEYFIIRKGCLEAGLLPCGCGKHYRWKEQQYLLRVVRVSKVKNFIVTGLTTRFSGVHTKINCECIIDGHKWTPTINNIINNDMGCPKCAGSLKYTEQEALQKCIDICKQMNYDVVGFVDGYKGVRKTKFKYICSKHGLQTVTYFDFVNGGTRCPSCAETGYNPNKPGSFYIVKWTKENHSFIKFGITNRDVETRIKQQYGKTEYEYNILFKKLWKNGHIPLYFEKEIKMSELSVGAIDRRIFEDGFTETIEIKDLDKLLSILHNMLCCVDSQDR